jgi:hypothetical protein
MDKSIYKIKEFGRYIDLARLISVSDVIEDQDDIGNRFVSFEITFQLQEKPIILSKICQPLYNRLDMDCELYNQGGHLVDKTTDNLKYEHYPAYTKDGKTIDAIELQAVVDRVIEAWSAYRAYERLMNGKLV